jgi:hypothetical protein
VRRLSDTVIPPAVALAIVLAILCLFLTGCQSMRVEVGAGYGTAFGNEREWEGKQPSVLLRVRGDITESVGCEYQHVSNLLSGPPFNNDIESSLDFFGCTVAVWGY